MKNMFQWAHPAVYLLQLWSTFNLGRSTNSDTWSGKMILLFITCLPATLSPDDRVCKYRSDSQSHQHQIYQNLCGRKQLTVPWLRGRSLRLTHRHPSGEYKLKPNQAIFVPSSCPCVYCTWKHSPVHAHGTRERRGNNISFTVKSISRWSELNVKKGISRRYFARFTKPPHGGHLGASNKTLLTPAPPDINPIAHFRTRRVWGMRGGLKQGTHTVRNSRATPPTLIKTAKRTNRRRIGMRNIKREDDHSNDDGRWERPEIRAATEKAHSHKHTDTHTLTAKMFAPNMWKSAVRGCTTGYAFKSESFYIHKIHKLWSNGKLFQHRTGTSLLVGELTCSSATKICCCRICSLFFWQLFACISHL